LKLDWREVVAEHAPHSDHKVIGNVPYYITSPLIDKALTAPLPERIVFLVQKEVADRLAAPPGGKTYGALTVGVHAVADVERLFSVKRGAFNPPPAVDSAVVRITPKAEPLVSPEEQPAFRTFVKALFSRRRKQMAGIVRAVASLTQDRAVEVLARVQVDPQARPETLAPETVVRLFRALQPSAG
jgi:16S rRNA (adenine1518-N6/adenine1519-N6)-dimethyltransferase